MGEGRPGSGLRITRRGSEASAAGCGSGCGRCGAAVECDQVAPPGGSVAGRAAGYFLFPLLLAVGGAVAGGGPVGQCLGAILGLVGGMAAAAVVVRLRSG